MSIYRGTCGGKMFTIFPSFEKNQFEVFKLIFLKLLAVGLIWCSGAKYVFLPLFFDYITKFKLGFIINKLWKKIFCEPLNTTIIIFLLLCCNVHQWKCFKEFNLTANFYWFLIDICRKHITNTIFNIVLQYFLIKKLVSKYCALLHIMILKNL